MDLYPNTAAYIRASGYYWIKLGNDWIIAEWTPCGNKGYGSFWTCGDEVDIEINERWTYERRGIQEVDERKIQREMTGDIAQYLSDKPYTPKPD